MFDGLYNCIIYNRLGAQPDLPLFSQKRFFLASENIGKSHSLFSLMRILLSKLKVQFFRSPLASANTVSMRRLRLELRITPLLIIVVNIT
jgi:hypothetical protein